MAAGMRLGKALGDPILRLGGQPGAGDASSTSCAGAVLEGTGAVAIRMSGCLPGPADCLGRDHFWSAAEALCKARRREKSLAVLRSQMPSGCAKRKCENA